MFTSENDRLEKINRERGGMGFNDEYAFVVRDSSGRHPDHQAKTEEQAYDIVRRFTQYDPESRCYVMRFVSLR